MSIGRTRMIGGERYIKKNHDNINEIKEIMNELKKELKYKNKRKNQKNYEKD